MILNLSDRNLTVIEKGTYYFQLSDYPRIKDYEWQNIIAFINYEKAHGRNTEVVCESLEIVSKVKAAAALLDGTQYIPPVLDGEEYIYHATDVIAAKKILTSGRLLSATKVYGQTIW